MIIEKVNGEKYSECRIPGMVITERGTLIAYYECRKAKSDWAEIDIKIIRSTDDGDTWHTVNIIEGQGNTLNNPVMFANGSQIHFLFLKNYTILYHCVSVDEGQTFSEPQEVRLEHDFFYNVIAVGPGHGIVHNGKMIVPVWFAQNQEHAKAHHPSIIATLYSTDGDVWHIGEIIGKDVLTNPSECALAVTTDNKILISIRNEDHRRQRAFALSDNGFSNWGDAYFNPQMPDPVCMGSMCHENGKIYHINCNSSTVRDNLTVKISSDCFNSYEAIFIDTPAGYSDIAVKNGKLYVLYEHDYNYGELCFKRIDL